MKVEPGNILELHWSTKKNFWIGARDISAKIYHINGADSENHIYFATLALVFEISTKSKVEKCEFTNIYSCIWDIKCCQVYLSENLKTMAMSQTLKNRSEKLERGKETPMVKIFSF